MNRARVRDVSESGIGLSVDDPRGAAIGDAIRIMSRDRDQARRARIVRMKSTPEEPTLLGCRWISDGANRMQIARARHARRRTPAAPTGNTEPTGAIRHDSTRN